jgi:hypothetical protein
VLFSEDSEMSTTFAMQNKIRKGYSLVRQKNLLLNLPQPKDVKILKICVKAIFFFNMVVKLLAEDKINKI